MLTFNDADHSYRWNGQPVPGVTSLLTPLYDFSFVDPDLLERKATLGHAVHLACELYDNDDLDEGSLDPQLRPYLDAWIKFKAEQGFVVALNEQYVFHHQLRYAGKLDRYGLLKDKSSVVDIKTTAALSPAIGIQLAAYEEALKSAPDWMGPRKLSRWAVQLKDDGTYALKEYKETTDWSAFVGLLNVAAWKRKHNIKE